MKRIHLRKKRKNYKKNIFGITIFVLLIVIILIINFIGNKITPGVINYAEMELEKFTSRVINEVISNNINDLSFDELFIISKDDNNYVKTIDYNPVSVNKVLGIITNKVDKLLRSVEKGEALTELSSDILLNYDKEKLRDGIIFEMAIATIFDNPLLSNIGPKIPVRITLLGTTNSNINTKITSFGINNALVETSIVINVNMQIVLPYKTKKVSLQNSIMVAMKIIEGNIPSYYFNGLSQNSKSYLIPVE